MPSTTITIRPLEEADEEDWRKIFREYRKDFHDEEIVLKTTFSRLIDENERMHAAFAIDQDGQIVGLVHWVYYRSTVAVNDDLYLHDIYVKDNVRSGGVGRSLIEYVYKDADTKGAAKVYWQTKHDNHRAQLLYTKVASLNGFICYERPKKNVDSSSQPSASS